MRYLNTSTLSNAPSVLFIDLRLPGVSGFDILQQTQKTPALAKTFKLAISSLHDIHSIKRAYVLGAETFVTKPIHEADLRELVRSYCDYWIFAAKNATTTPSPPPQVLN